MGHICGDRDDYVLGVHLTPNISRLISLNIINYSCPTSVLIDNVEVQIKQNMPEIHPAIKASPRRLCEAPVWYY